MFSNSSPNCSSFTLNPKLINKYDGSIIKLNEKYSMSKEDFPSLETVIGEDILVTDGEHLMGGDDKAGIAIIVEFAKYFISHKEEFNYNLAISFTCDEEIGRGASKFNVERMNADVAYTLDGESIYEANFENFNAASAEVEIDGIGVHPGMAYGVMINALLVAMEFHLMLPKDMIPSKTKDHEGFIHLEEFKGDVEKAKLSYIFISVTLNVPVVNVPVLSKIISLMLLNASK